MTEMVKFHSIVCPPGLIQAFGRASLGQHSDQGKYTPLICSNANPYGLIRLDMTDAYPLSKLSTNIDPL